jgi:hypothetical protein
VVRTTISQCLEGDRSRYGHQGWKDHLQALVKPLRRAADVAEDLQIPYGIENHQDICSSTAATPSPSGSTRRPLLSGSCLTSSTCS